MKLEILTPDKSLFSGKVRSIRVPGEKGAFMVLLNHAPIISNLAKGDIVFTTQDYKEETIAIGGGVIEVKKNSIVVLADV
ncbi:MAG: ATP synthase F1 subunit epsilon [Bacteroidota bacterium]|nr:MAG: ATP synthase F1 subunit epsilon [Bacteroidota bacterium]